MVSSLIELSLVEETGKWKQITKHCDKRSERWLQSTAGAEEEDPLASEVQMAWKFRAWADRWGQISSSNASLLRDLGHIIQPLCASVSLSINGDEEMPVS